MLQLLSFGFTVFHDRLRNSLTLVYQIDAGVWIG